MFVCFLYESLGSISDEKDDPELQREYKEYHKNVWPEMHAALNRQGWHNYSLFLRPDGTLFGVFESDRTLQECIAGMEKEEINAKWQAAMKKFVSSICTLETDCIPSRPIERFLHAVPRSRQAAAG